MEIKLVARKKETDVKLATGFNKCFPCVSTRDQEKRDTGEGWGGGGMANRR